MFSQRTRWQLARNRPARILDEKRRRGVPVLDLTESNPTHVGLAYPEDLLSPLADPGALSYDPAPQGLHEAREAVAADYARRSFSTSPDRLVLTSGTSEAYSFLFKLLADPGDEILVPAPCYPLFEFLAALESLRLEHYPLAYDGRWGLDLEALEDAVSPRTRAVVVVNPGNPTGAYLKRGEAEALLRLCAERRLAVVSDEVFADYGFREDPERLASVAEDGPALAFSLGGLSKSCGLPQVKLGWIAGSGPASLRREALERLEVVADTYLSVATPVQRAAPALLARLPELQAPIAARVRGNLGELARRAAASAATLLDVEGGWYAVLRVPATLPEEDRACRLLEERNVLVHPGYFFDFPGEAYLVLSLLPPPDVFAEGVERLLADVGA